MTTEAPRNLHIHPTGGRDYSESLPQRVEQKFYVTPKSVSPALALLRRCCRPDPRHPSDHVNSLYFDTPALDQHEASDSGEFAKDKVRIRWYGDAHDPHAAGDANEAAETLADAWVDVWLELKSRRGFASTKQRTTMSVRAGTLAPFALQAGIVDPRTLLETVTGFGFFAQDRLIPVVAISYWRYRFVEPWTGYRISLDSRIRSTMVMRGHGWGERGLRLPGAVIEVKGAEFSLPPSLLSLARLGTSWTRYSKYSSSLDAHAAKIGEVSRLWPSGLMDPEPGALSREEREARQRTIASPRWVPLMTQKHETE